MKAAHGSNACCMRMRMPASVRLQSTRDWGGVGWVKGVGTEGARLWASQPWGVSQQWLYMYMRPYAMGQASCSK